MQTEIGDGTNTLFWRDRWIHGHRVEDIAPRRVAYLYIKKKQGPEPKKLTTDHTTHTHIRLHQHPWKLKKRVSLVINGFLISKEHLRWK
jgi:hypothetical protein